MQGIRGWLWEMVARGGVPAAGLWRMEVVLVEIEELLGRRPALRDIPWAGPGAFSENAESAVAPVGGVPGLSLWDLWGAERVGSLDLSG